MTVEAGTGKREAGSAARKPIQHYRDIEAYQRAKELLAPVHALVRRFPREEQYEVASQIRRASKSIRKHSGGLRHQTVSGQVPVVLGHRSGFRERDDRASGGGHAIGYFEQGEVDELIERYEIVAKQLYRLIQSWQDFTNSKTRAAE